MPIEVQMDEHISVEFAIYFLPEPTTEPLAELDELLRDEFTSFRLVQTIDKETEHPILAARIEVDPKHAYAPPELESLRYSGRGLSRAQAEALQETKSVLILDFAYPKERVWDGLRSTTALTHSLAQSTGGLIWDEATREVFSPDSWEERRIKDWEEVVPNISKHVTIHAYNSGEHVRAVTLGMAKFGLPDVVIENFSWSLSRNMGHIVNLFVQAMAEGASLRIPGDFDLDFKLVKNAKVREPQVTTLKANATGIALLRLQKGTRDEGDPRNRLMAITFDRGKGPDIYAKQEQVVGAAFGFEDSITHVKHDEEIQAASRQARTKLPGLRADFKKGLAPGEFIMVKAPFKTTDNRHEYMWVEISSWEGDKIKGLLKNEPRNVPGLHAGQFVEVLEADIFDYIRQHADGTSDGNETAKLLERRSN